jgi:hypothetical protein
LQLNLSEVKAQLLHKSQVEARIGEMKQELTQISATLKVTEFQSLVSALE